MPSATFQNINRNLSGTDFVANPFSILETGDTRGKYPTLSA
jgi:hypothetical protein